MKIELELSSDTPTSMTFGDTFAGLANPWYAFRGYEDGSVDLWATPEGFEHLARIFLKFARSSKRSGYHFHATLEQSDGPPMGGPELTVGVVDDAGEIKKGAV